MARRFLLTAAAVSVLIHIATALLIVFLPKVMPKEAASHPQGTVELLMVEEKGAQPSQARQPPQNKPAPPQPPPQPEKKAEPPKAEPQKAETQEPAAKPVPAPPVAEKPDVPAPSPVEQPPPKETKAEEKPDVKQPPVPPTPPPAQEAPVFDLAGTESQSNAVVLGGQILPASPDDRFRNRPPVYPQEAVRRGETGTVDVLIHVSDKGLATGVDVLTSSGVDVLDRAVVDAVQKWHFRPAMQEGQAVPFDMPFRFIFEPY